MKVITPLKSVCVRKYSWSRSETTRSSTGPVDEYRRHKPSGVDLKFRKGGEVICVASAVITFKTINRGGSFCLLCRCWRCWRRRRHLINLGDCGDSGGSPPHPELRIHYLSLPFSFRAFSFFVNGSTLPDKESVRAACSV